MGLKMSCKNEKCKRHSVEYDGKKCCACHKSKEDDLEQHQFSSRAFVIMDTRKHLKNKLN